MDFFYRIIKELRSVFQMTSPIKGYCRSHIPNKYMFGENLDLCQTLIEIPSRIPSDGTGILIRKITWRVELDKK